ncbi:acetyl-CoA carboxylase biotin carboxyl carrier protein [Pandoraea iniqua]|uniref:acetyl-CoA carboxylase biotin carboxyl carrier protein n=1 Tax=Pandoraea iniqua TaxID=2508288 RepID=UPI001FE7D0E9|nr:acetyl-CoA carboxylase biotin carboxyl carrier protein [Pandoraea iniqua]
MSETSMSRRLEEVQKLAEVFSKTHLVEMEIEAADFSLRLKKNALGAGATVAAPTAAAPAAAIVPAATDASTRTVKSGMSGTFFRASAPGDAPFVKTGDEVDVGQKLCLIEAMKMLNEVDCDWAGTVKEILAEDGGVVSVGTPLFVIEVNGNV